MKRIFVVVAIFILLPFFHASASSGNTETKELQESVKQLQDRIDQLEKKLDESIKRQEVYTEAEDNRPLEERETQIELRDSFSDKQEAAPRVDDMTVQPEYKGFIPIPHTSAMIKFNARPRLDITNDTDFAGNENRFVTADIPVKGEIAQGGGHQFNMNGQGSQLSMDVRSPGTDGNPRFYYENDFSGAGNAYLNYKVRHLYGQFYNIVVGQTYTVFEDADAWPDTVDYEGPNAAISARQPLIKYMLLLSKNWELTVSLEKPAPQVDTTGDISATSEIHAPDGGFHFKWAKKGVGHVQFATIFRDLGVSGNVVGDQDTFGWGLNLSGSLNVFKHDSFQTQLTYGQGIYYYMNDSDTNNDAAFDSAGKLQPLPVEAAMVGYTHTWSDKFRSTASFGVVNLENQFSQLPSAYHRTYYASANLVFQLYKRLSFGLEGLYGYKQEKSSVSGDVVRVQTSIMYSLFQ